MTPDRKAKLHLCWLLLVTLLPARPCSAQPSPAVQEWYRKVAVQVRAHLRVPPGFAGRTEQAWVDFEIARTGKIKSMKLVQSAGAPELDAAALAAIEAAQPFPLPPEGNDNLFKIPVPIDFAAAPPSDIDRGEEKLKAQLRGICRGC